MSKFRKRPIVVEATQWWKNGDHPEDYSQQQYGIENGERKNNRWEGDVVRYFMRSGISGDSLCKSSIPCGRAMHEHGWIDTPESSHVVCPGDWIITGVAGERYPCKPSIFEATYEAAADAATVDRELAVDYTAALRAEVSRLRDAVEKALDVANGRWSEWGNRAEDVEETLRLAVRQPGKL